MAAADLLVLPSVFEGLPTVILEAFRAGLAVAGSRIDGTTELITPHETGWLFEPDSPNNLAETITEAYKNEGQRTTFAQNGQQLFYEHFTLEKYIEATEKLYTGPKSNS